MSEKIIVIGGGLGGLSAAISLAADGHRVSLLEKNEHFGGKLNVHKEDGFEFDMGPSIFSLTKYFDSLFERCGKNRNDYFELESISPYWRNFFEDYSTIDLYMDDDSMKKELDKVSPKAYDEYLKFLKYARQNHDLISTGYFEKGLDTNWEMIKHYGFWNLMVKLDSKQTMDKANRKNFSDKKMIDIFNFFIKYVGSSAVNAPAFFNMMPIIHVDHDLFYVKGGMFNLSKALQKLASEMGVELVNHCPIEEIIKEGKTVTAVRSAQGKVYKADRIVSNMEVIPTYKYLLNEDPKWVQKLEKKFEPTCSGLVLHLGTNKKFPKLAHHNFFYSENQSKHFATVFDKKEIPQDPTLYVVAPTRTDPSKAPEGKDNIKILPHIPYLADGKNFTQEDYEKLKDRIIDKVERIACPGLRESIEVVHMWTPYDIESNYRSNRGSIYGVVSDRSTNFGFKFPKKSTQYSNLYFVGGSVNPGGGMPMVVLSGQKAADRIKEDISKGK